MQPPFRLQTCEKEDSKIQKEQFYYSLRNGLTGDLFDSLELVVLVWDPELAHHFVSIVAISKRGAHEPETGFGFT